jgi:hypothetical protein
MSVAACAVSCAADPHLADGTIERARPRWVRRGELRMLSDVQVAMERAGARCEHEIVGRNDAHRVVCHPEDLKVVLTSEGEDRLDVTISFDPRLPCAELEWRRDHRPSRSGLDGFCAMHGAAWAYLKLIEVAPEGLPSDRVSATVVTFARAANANYRAILEFPEGAGAPTSTP